MAAAQSASNFAEAALRSPSETAAAGASYMSICI